MRLREEVYVKNPHSACQIPQRVSVHVRIEFPRSRQQRQQTRVLPMPAPRARCCIRQTQPLSHFLSQKLVFWWEG